MKLITTFAIVLGIAISAQADTNIVAQTLYADGTTNTWTQADLQQALGLMNRKYHRDMASEQGRTSWHGGVKKTIVTTNTTSGVIEYKKIYEDGYEHTRSGQVVNKISKARKELIKIQSSTLPDEVKNILSARVASTITTNEVIVVNQGK